MKQFPAGIEYRTALPGEVIKMLNISLLERLDGFSEHIGRPDRTRIVDSIFRNLQLILNSRPNACETRPDFGLSDTSPTNDIQQSALYLAQDVAAQLQAFEPRLRNIQVQHSMAKGDLARLAFDISAELADPEDAQPLAFQSVMTSDGHVLVIRQAQT